MCKVKKSNQYGFGLLEILIVILLLAILTTLAIPQLTASSRLLRQSGVQRQLVTVLREARQEALTQRRSITVTFNNSSKTFTVSGGAFGAFGAAQNKTVTLLQSSAIEFTYGIPQGFPAEPLKDLTAFTPLSQDKLHITFTPDGSVKEPNGEIKSKVLFFFDPKYPESSAFAVSVLGAGGRVKLWKYNQASNTYEGQ